MSGCVHCNYCGSLPSPEATSFCLSNCGHIFCKGCIDKDRLKLKCNQCNAAAPKFVPIDRNLNPNLQLMFKKPLQFVSEHGEELTPLMKFQNTQRALRFKGQQMMIKHEKEKRIELQGQVTTMRDQMKMLQREYTKNRSRNSSIESMRSVSRGDNISDTSSLHHHTMSSSVSSNETTMMYLDPFKTPCNGLKRFTTSTPKARLGEGPTTKKLTASGMSSRHSASVPSLTSFSMEIDDDEIMDVTPARHHHHHHSSRASIPMDTPTLLQMQSGQNPPLSTNRPKASSKMMIDYDPILGGAPKTPLPKTPAPKKSMQSLSMAERLSAPRPPTTKTPQKQLQQPEVTSSTTPGGGANTVNKPKTPCATPLLNAKLKPTPITPIRPIHGSQLPTSTVASVKHPEKASTSSSSAFKTPSLPAAKKPTVAARTMPPGMKTGSYRDSMGATARTAGISQPQT